MGKDLPWFKFIVSEWRDGDIDLETYKVQGVFINLCAYYWSNECKLTLEKAKRKFKANKEIGRLIFIKILKVDNNDFITINFLNEQFDERRSQSLINSKNGAKGGRPSKREIKPNALESLTETKGIKKRKEEKTEEDKREDVKELLSQYFILYSTSDTLIEDFCKAQTTKKAFLLKMLEIFTDELKLKGVINKTWQDYQSHFLNWFKQNKHKHSKKNIHF
jgi:hypothetical protein